MDTNSSGLLFAASILPDGFTMYMAITFLNPHTCVCVFLEVFRTHTRHFSMHEKKNDGHNIIYILFRCNIYTNEEYVEKHMQEKS
mmetsp:Transcript_17396/g.25560  ORF Transcript_17396/g.25560 Transcript_17396/m.25560 type:complete len:85 (+) Transcript_17396:30-284(+)